MARYDDGFGLPRGGWRARRQGPYDRRFPDGGGMPRGGHSGPGAYGGGDWSRESISGGGRGPSFGGRDFGGRGYGDGAYGGGPMGRGWDRGEGGGYRIERWGQGGEYPGRGLGRGANRSGGVGFGSGGRSEGPGTLASDNRSGLGFGSGNRSYGGGMSGGSPGGWAYRAGMDRGEWRGGRGGWDRGEYGAAYEEDSGYPGVPVRGEYYGAGRPSQRRGYDAGFAREPFIPEEAYRRHPEYRQERQPRDWEAHQRDFGDGDMSDEEIREAVYDRMHADAWLEPERIDVRVEDGVVTLTGEVDDFLKARYAWDDAWEADGVRGVVNHLTVRADEPRQEPHGDVVTQSGGERTSPDDAGAMS